VANSIKNGENKDQVPNSFWCLYDYLTHSGKFTSIVRVTYIRFRLNNSNLWIDFFEKDHKVKLGEDFNPAPVINDVQLYNTKNIDLFEFISKCPRDIAIDLLFFVNEFSE